MSAETEAAGNARHAHDLDWKNSMEEEVKGVKAKLTEGVGKFRNLEEGQKQILEVVAENTRMTQESMRVASATDEKLDKHVESYEAFKGDVAPVLKIIRSAESFFAWLGKWGDRIAWLGKWSRRVVVWVGGAAAGIYAIIQLIEKIGKK